MPISNRLASRHCSTSDGLSSRTALYGPVRRVVWQGSVGDRRPYADLTGNPEIENARGRNLEPCDRSLIAVFQPNPLAKWKQNGQLLELVTVS
jgi:hypothetical protein